MEKTIKVKITENKTIAKPGAKQSKDYLEHQIVRYSKGTLIEITSYEVRGNHTVVKLKRNDPKTGRDFHWFYKPHIEIYGNVAGNDPSAEAAKRQESLANTKTHQEDRKTNNRGQRVYVVGVGYRYLNDPIDGTQSFYWYEALRNGQRMPEHKYQGLNILDIAKRLQYAKVKKLGGAPMIITSWLRPAAINRAIGGSSLSTHIAGGGVDWYVPNMSESEVYRALNPDWDRGLAIRPGAFIHTDNGYDAYDRLMGYKRRWDY